MTRQLVGISLAAAQGHARHIPLIILATLIVITAAAAYYAWHRRR